jgi:niacin transporter
MKNRSVYHLTISGLLIAVGIVIPMVSPFKIILEPASFTLASHVAIFVAMFISPGIAVTVAIGTTIGFFLGGFPLVVVLRAASHIIFATAGAFYLHGKKAMPSVFMLRLFSFSIAIIHAFCEVLVVSMFYFYGSMGDSYYQQGFITSVFLLVGVGTVVHSMVDFEIANVVRMAMRKHLRKL